MFIATGDTLRPLCFLSRRTSPDERRWCGVVLQWGEIMRSIRKMRSLPFWIALDI